MIEHSLDELYDAGLRGMTIGFYGVGEGYDAYTGRPGRFEPEHRPMIEEVVAELLRLKTAHPERFSQSHAFMRSIPDWLILGPDMKVPCDAYQLVWIGADGGVQLCDVHFPLGNVHEKPLREILYGPEHKKAARDGFALACPNCTCKLDSRIRKDPASWRRYKG